MMKHFVIILALILTFSIVTANVTTINELMVDSDEAYFLVEIENIKDTPKDLQINFYAPLTSQIVSTSTLAPFSKTSAKIYVKNEFNEYTEITAKLEVYLDGDLEEKEILLKFNKTDKVINQEINNDEQVFAGLFGLTTFVEEASNFGSIEYVLLFVLILIATVLLVAFIARIIKRVN